MKKILLLAAIVSLSVMHAQKNFRKEADKAFTIHEYFTSLELYKVAYTKATKKDDKAAIIFRTAECYRMLNDYKQEEVWYTKAIQVNYPDPVAIFYLANALKSMGKYDEATIQFNKYKKEVPADQRGEDGAKSCQLAAKWKDNPSRYKVENMTQINSSSQDFSPAFPDRKYTALNFTSAREGSTGGVVDGNVGQTFSDIFETKIDKNGKWSTPVPLAEPINTAANEGANVVNRKGNMMIFTRCMCEKNKKFMCGLYITVKKGQLWDEPKLIPFCTDSFTFKHPALSLDEQTLVFSSDMPGGFGSSDLWVSTFNKNTKEWGAPVNLGPEVNTAGYDAFPFITDDGTLYYSSDGHLGMGGLDIFKAEKKGDAKWGSVSNIEYPINSPSDDFGIIFEAKMNRGYFSSNREGGKGSDDIYFFYMPALEFSIEGEITNCKVHAEVIEGVTMRLVGTDGSLEETVTDKNGHYSFEKKGDKRLVNENTSYVISTIIPPGADIKTESAKLSFINSSVKAKETTIALTSSKHFVHDFCLEPIIKTDNHFGDVLYDFDSALLTQQAKDTLDILYNILIDNPTFVIELSSHTDFRGEDAYNQKLSEARAKSCVEYLVSKGVNKDRMVAKGYGEKKPLEITDSLTGKVVILDQKYIMKLSPEGQEEAHHKNRRTVFRVLRKDFHDNSTSQL